jgi:iron complex outermembrane receptor protein
MFIQMYRILNILKKECQMYKTKNRSVTKQIVSKLPLTAAIYLALHSVAFAANQEAFASDQQQTNTMDRKAVLDTVTVTAQKRTENLQTVPISIQVLGTQRLTEMNISDFDDYAKLLPSLSYTQGEGGNSTPYFRGVVSGGDGNHSGSSPSVGVYLDEQPVTTIGGALGIHIYDIERVEALAGPQGTLYGASSQSGTLRIITNKPDVSGFAAGYALEANTVTDGGNGYVGEGFINLPVSDTAAIRLVAWNQSDAGWIDNVPGERTFPTSGITMNNADRVEKNYNDSTSTGARGALKLDLNENWSVLASVMSQKEKANGSFAFDPVVGKREISRYYPESLDDKFTQAALTVTGKLGNFDLVYSFANLSRDINSESDYNDYGFWYDVVSGYGAYAIDNNYDYVNPSQYILGKDKYKKRNHELRISSPQDERFRFIGGFFMQDQSHDIQQRYKIDDFADFYDVKGWEDTIWLTKQDRRDSEQAIFGEASFDFTDKLTATAGFRYFEHDNDLKGFFGFSRGFASQSKKPPSERYGEAGCAVLYGTDDSKWVPFNGAPCKQFDKTTSENGTLGKFNLTYKIDDKRMIYGTWSEGYRPGGINRRAILPPYLSDYLTNWELGWKTSWMDNRLTFNGAVFRQEWKDFQFSILGANGLTEIKNANQAKIDGLEMDVNFAATYNLSITGGMAFYDAKLTDSYCGWVNDTTGDPETVCPPGTLNPDGDAVDGPEAPKGTRLPVTAKFKSNLTARYTFDWKDFEPFIQGSIVHESKRSSDLRIVERDILGDLPPYTVFDLSTGIRKDNWTLNLYVKNLFDKNAEFNRFTMCAESVCGAAGYDTQYPNGQVYTVASRPRTIGLRFSQEF